MLYRNFSNQDEIDREYNPRLRVEQTDQFLTKYLSESERVRKTLNHQDGIQYGPTLNEVLDYYPSSEAQATLLVPPLHGFSGMRMRLVSIPRRLEWQDILQEGT